MTNFFRDFYRQRLEKGLVVEGECKQMSRVAELSDSEIQGIMLTKPFEKFERRKFVRRLKEITVLKFAEPLWRSLTEQDKVELQKLAEVALLKYYAQLAR